MLGLLSTFKLYVSEGLEKLDTVGLASIPINARFVQSSALLDKRINFTDKEKIFTNLWHP